jgi:uncharacterized LabA/DUF88 family protein
VSAANTIFRGYFSMKACVFVDGENFRHSIVKLFPRFQQEKYLPKNAAWAELFDWLVSQAVEGCQRIRTYWYVIKTLDFFPYNLPNPDTVSTNIKDFELLKVILSKYKPYQDEIDALKETSRKTRMIEMLSELCKRHDEMENRFDGWTAIQEGISSKHKGIEFRRAGAMICNLFENSLGTEKAVDVKLASDMITLKDIYDISVIVSGDQDYVPAVEVVKDAGKQVVNVAFLTRSGELLPGGARRLNQITDWHLNVPFETFENYLHI